VVADTNHVAEGQLLCLYYLAKLSTDSQGTSPRPSHGSRKKQTQRGVDRTDIDIGASNADGTDPNPQHRHRRDRAYLFVDRRNQVVIVMMSSQANPLDAELISLTMTTVSHFREILALSQ
jgi:hypothetical protein